MVCYAKLLTKLWFCRKLSGSLLGLPQILLSLYWDNELYLDMWSPKSVKLYLGKHGSTKKTIHTMYNKGQK